jgi:hypothetical protein
MVANKHTQFQFLNQHTHLQITRLKKHSTIKPTRIQIVLKSCGFVLCVTILKSKFLILKLQRQMHHFLRLEKLSLKEIGYVIFGCFWEISQFFRQVASF